MRSVKKTLLLVICCALFAWTACLICAEQRTHVCRYCQQSAGRESAPAKESGLIAVHWLQAKPHASYLLCLVAGHLRTLEGRYRGIPLGFVETENLRSVLEDTNTR